MHRLHRSAASRQPSLCLERRMLMSALLRNPPAGPEGARALAFRRQRHRRGPRRPHRRSCHAEPRASAGRAAGARSPVGCRSLAVRTPGAGAFRATRGACGRSRRVRSLEPEGVAAGVAASVTPDDVTRELAVQGEWNAMCQLAETPAAGAGDVVFKLAILVRRLTGEAALTDGEEMIQLGLAASALADLIVLRRGELRCRTCARRRSPPTRT